MLSHRGWNPITGLTRSCRDLCENFRNRSVSWGQRCGAAPLTSYPQGGSARERSAWGLDIVEAPRLDRPFGSGEFSTGFPVSTRG